MSDLDLRKPSEVTADFRARLANLLVPRGFVARAKNAGFTRKQGRNRHKVDLSSSHYNNPGHAICWVSFDFIDAAVRSRYEGWHAGGIFYGPFFHDGEKAPENVALAEEANALAKLVQERLTFFDLLENPPELLHAVCARYVPGTIAPSIIVPYLRVRLGPDAVRQYARALLAARQELWPAFVSVSRGASAPSSMVWFDDHGTQLAAAMAGQEELDLSDIPPDVTRSSMGGLRCRYGLQLRAWGEPEAAALLRRVSDDELRQLSSQEGRLPDFGVDSRDAVRLTLRVVTGEDRNPRRDKQVPRFFQYIAGYGSFDCINDSGRAL